MSEWISFKTATPGWRTPVWVNSDYGVLIAALFPGEGWCEICDPPVFYQGEWLIDGYEVSEHLEPTHWMPLPAPPSA